MNTTTAILPLSISNAYLLRSDRPVLVDAGAPGDADALCSALARYDVRVDDLAAVVLTHGHTDHTGALPLLAAAGVPVVVGAGDAHLLRSGRNAALPATGPAGALLRPLIRRMTIAPVAPDVLVETTFSLSDLGAAAEVRVVGGHTAGSCIVASGDDLLVGDLVRGGFAGGRIRPGHPLRHYFTEDPCGLRHALSTELGARPRRLLVGHGGPLDADDVRRRLDRVAPLPLHRS